MATSPPHVSVPRTLPSVFVGSSSQGFSVAEAIQSNLAADCETRIWDQGVIPPAQSTLEALAKAAEDVDFAILVLTPDDVSESRGQRQACPRDNVLFEIGLFVGSVGRLRTFLVVDKTVRMNLPSDLAGVTCTDYRPFSSSDDLRPALGPACISIRRAIKQQGPRTVAGPIPRHLWRDFVDILAFAKSMHTSFQALDTSHLDSLSQTVWDLLTGNVSGKSRRDKKMESIQAWNQYITQFTAHQLQLHRDADWNSLDQSFQKLHESLSLEARPEIVKCRDFYGSIKTHQADFLLAHDTAIAILGKGNLIELLDKPDEGTMFWVSLDRLSKTGKGLITQADAMIVNLVNLIADGR
jgi:Predicted nucleotide-binding protein containing TIR-like domain